MSQRLKLIGVMVEPLRGTNQQKNGYHAVAPLLAMPTITARCSVPLPTLGDFPMLLYIGSKETKLVGQRLSLENNYKSSLHNSVFKLLASHCISKHLQICQIMVSSGTALAPQL